MLFKAKFQKYKITNTVYKLVFNDIFRRRWKKICHITVGITDFFRELIFIINQMFKE